MPAIPVAPLVGLLGTTVTLETYGLATRNAYGEAVDPAPTTTTIVAAVHPAPARMLERLPEADRTKETIAVYTTTSIRTASSGGRPNVVVYQARRYEVTQVEDYQGLGGVYITLAQLRGVTA